MKAGPDPLIIALTGKLPFILIAAGVLALFISLFLLWLYRRAVLRSMRARGAASPLPPTPPPGPSIQLPPSSDLRLEIIDPSAAIPSPSGGQTFFRQAQQGPRQAATVYVLAGAAYAVVMTVGWLIATRDEFLPIKFLWLFWSYLWPAVLTTALVAGSTLRARAFLWAAYFIVLGILAEVALVRNPQLTLGQLILAHWLLTNAPATVLLLAFLNRRVRAVGPMVLVFMVVAAIGSIVTLDIAGSSESRLRFVAETGFALGLSATGVLISLVVIGFAAFGIAGWPVLNWIRRRYQRKQISDQSLTLDSIWLLFGIVQSIGLAFEGPKWMLTGLAAFIFYKAVTRLGFRSSGLFSAPTGESPQLLLLRVFSLGKRSERLFDALGKHWLRLGSIRLISGPDLATTTVEPHEFLDFLSGKLARRFIDGPDTLKLRLSEMDTRPDWDGRFRVADFFCHEDTWKMVLSRLVGESDGVLMDLRGFSPQKAGCIFEIEELLNLASLRRVLFVIDKTTDAAFLEETTRQAWNRLRPESPNRQSASNQLRLFRLTGSLSRELPLLLHWLCSAAATEPSPK